ncbi:hypothetical protein DICPUDRAFT_26867 [Dictyostelium purpureum]|uniref:Chloride channel protein n=1 Tax=Dictyostelium purpureum TaxID=5786 RepID=F0Z9E9_DICPU|nr:uncharacterized protein DICPUDRAFT_26867 [Dictyostelium purpureum]EGC39462.1 hypothetical protein DICPUDRAFT_26867 [Dictyostelium purpureum]|eukprot:XP_003284020.1 hypothetical protein DICPUDRAFT_26867 [Dictyostelium purpureum]
MDNKKDYLLLNVQQDPNDDTPIHPSITHRRHNKKTSHHERALMSNFESLDFSEIDNILLRQYNSRQKKIHKLFKTLGKWVICTLIGILVGIFCYCLKESVDQLQKLKYNYSSIYKPFFIYLGFNLLYGIVSCLIVCFCGPLSSSSGLPEVKGYLNGIRISKAFNLKTVLGKITSLIFSFSSGLVLGPEGPMFHIGSGLGSSMSQFKSKTLRFHLRSFWVFQNDSDKRDFISCGAAAGIAAAFGAPIGGVLFALEEGSSFWSRQLTWRTFFSCLIATLIANLFLQGFGVKIHDYGVLTFGVSKFYLYTYTELIPFIIMGIIGGILGAIFVHFNLRINHLRKKLLGTNKLYKLLEVIFFVILTSTICFFPALLANCRPVSGIPTNSSGSCDDDIIQINTIQFNCQEGYYNPLATLTMTTLEDALQILFSRTTNIFTPLTLFVFTVFYFVLTTLTSGLYIASGIFIPMMLIGSAWGRLFGLLISEYFTSVDPSIYALIGAASMMAGSLRMTISLVVIIVELTETTQYLLPVITVVMVGKWVGDVFNESVYEHLIEFKHIPYLSSQPAYHLRTKTVAEAMSSDVKSFPEVVKVKTVIEVLETSTHNGFPVTMLPKLHEPTSSISEILCGLILRSQLSILLKRKIFYSLDELTNIDFINDKGYDLPIDHADFQQELASKIPSISLILNDISQEDHEKYIDLRPYMNFAVVSIKNYSSLTEAYRLFRLAGLRHIVVVNVFNHVVGMLTRKDLT